MIGERYPNPGVETVAFEELALGDVLAITTGLGADAWEYYFVIEKVEDGYFSGGLDGTNPQGEELGECAFELHGCARSDDRRARPSSYQGLWVGGFMVGRFPHSVLYGEKSVFDNPGQEISHIVLYRSQQQEATV